MNTKKKTLAKILAGALRHAAATGKLKRVRELLEKGADPNKRAIGQPTPLIAAASAGHLTVAKELITAGADPSFAHGGKRGTTALLEAIRHHRFDLASGLIAAGADVHHDWSGEGQTITSEAVRICNKLSRDAKGVEGRKARECLTVVGKLLRAGGKMKPGLFAQAAAGGNLDVVRLLLDSGFDINEGAGNSTAFSCAVFNDHEDLAVELLRRGADPWADDAMFGPALHQAVANGLIKVVRAVIDINADLNRTGDLVIGEAPPETLVERKDARGNVVDREWKFHPPPKARNATALIIAVRVGNVDMAQLLVEGGACLEATDSDGFTPLAWALKLDHEDIAALLRRAGAKAPTHLEGSPLHALLRAAEAGDLGKLRAAIAAGADVNAVYDADRERYTALMRAANAGHLRVVDELLKAGASPDQSGMDRTLTAGITPLMVAARGGHTSVVKRLLEAGARPEIQQVNILSLVVGPKRERGRPLNAAVHEAAAAGHAEIVKLLIEAGARPGDKSGASGTVLEAAAASGDTQTLDVVFSAKGQKRQKTGVSAQSLIAAVESGDRQSVRTLIASGANANSRTPRGDNALASAAANGDTDMVQLLLEAGAKPTTGSAKTPLNELMLAASGGYGDIVQLLLNAGANIDEQGFEGETALHWAVASAHAEVVETLLKAGASISIRNQEGKTPLQSAQQIICAWSGRNRHPIVGEATNLEAYRHCAKLLEEAGKVRRQ